MVIMDPAGQCRPIGGCRRIRLARLENGGLTRYPTQRRSTTVEAPGVGDLDLAAGQWRLPGRPNRQTGWLWWSRPLPSSGVRLRPSACPGLHSPPGPKAQSAARSGPGRTARRHQSSAMPGAWSNHLPGPFNKRVQCSEEINRIFNIRVMPATLYEHDF